MKHWRKPITFSLGEFIVARSCQLIVPGSRDFIVSGNREFIVAGSREFIVARSCDFIVAGSCEFILCWKLWIYTGCGKSQFPSLPMQKKYVNRKEKSVLRNEMWLVNVVLHAFEHLAKRSKYCGYVTCGGVRILHLWGGGPIFYIQPHWRHTRPLRLWHIRNWTRFFKVTEQYCNIPVACNGLVWEMFCKFCQNCSVISIIAEIRNE